jgi:hypothetical protein
LVLFAQSKLETIPVYDRLARDLAEAAMECPSSSQILTDLGWTTETPRADWETMLRLLPVERLQPLPWPGE